MRYITKGGIKIAIVLVAITIIAVFAYFYSKSQIAKVRQEDKLFIQAELVQNNSYAEIIKLNDSVNQILTDCLNSSSCDRAKAASEINTLNQKRDVINQDEQKAMDKLQILM